ENAAYGTSCYPFCASKIGSIGSSYEGTELRIADSGEIQVHGPCLMQGYYLEPEKTAAAFTADGFLKTGDRGEMDAQGQVRITGRLKEIFKTAKGKYVAPAPIEAKFMANPTIEQVCVTGNKLPQPIALVVLSEAAQQRQAEQVRKELEDQLRAINAGLERHQQLDRILICSDPWTTDNELLTPTLKVRRHQLEKRLADQISTRYDDQVVRLA
ncbi:MAG: AMP-binding protein, partial [Xanthomonadales bacterium]|nr:AMP-binding protein [Xanthomonadales bacterium]